MRRRKSHGLFTNLRTGSGSLLYNNSGKSRAAAQRSRDRRKAEDDAPRLIDVLPGLRSAKLAVTELVANGATKYIKHIVVARSPVLFIIPCGDPVCQDGGHDITSELMSAFRKRLATASGESACTGTTGTAECRRSIQYTLTAEYAS
jgi:hypothetical protein